jgi:hypothetical protein
VIRLVPGLVPAILAVLGGVLGKLSDLIQKLGLDALLTVATATW